MNEDFKAVDRPVLVALVEESGDMSLPLRWAYRVEHKGYLVAAVEDEIVAKLIVRLLNQGAA